MKTAKSEFFYAIFSIVLIALCGFIYLTKQQSPVKQTKPATHRQIKTSSETTAERELKAWVQQLEAVEKELTSENVSKLRSDYQALADSPEKNALEERLTTLENELNKLNAAEQAVLTAETYGYQSYIAEAQTAVTDLASSNQKDKLQARLDKLNTGATQPTVAPETTSSSTVSSD